MNETLDLDALVSETFSIKLNGKDYKANPLTLKQTIKIQKYFTSLVNSKTTDISKVLEILEEIAPGVTENDITPKQMMLILEFMTKSNTASSEKKNQPEKSVS